MRGLPESTAIWSPLVTNPVTQLNDWLARQVAKLPPRFARATYAPPAPEQPWALNRMALHGIPAAGTEDEMDYENITRIPR